MPTFKEFTGNYLKVVNTLGLPKDYYGLNSSRKEYDSQIRADIDQISYFNPYGDVDVLKNRLVELHLEDYELSYNSGNFNAGILTRSFIKKDFDVFVKDAAAAEGKNSRNTLSEHLSFSYLDNDNNLCGCSIAYRRDDSDKEIAVNNRPRPFVIAIIKHVNKAPDDREVTFISHTSFLTNIQGGKAIETQNLPYTITRALNCRPMEKLLLGVINKDNIALSKFNELKNRFPAGFNLDDKDAKRARINDLLILYVRLYLHEDKSRKHFKRMQSLVDLVSQAYGDTDFFKDKSLEDIDRLVKGYENDCLMTSLPPLEKPEETKNKLAKYIQTYCVNANTDYLSRRSSPKFAVNSHLFGLSS